MDPKIDPHISQMLVVQSQKLMTNFTFPVSVKTIGKKEYHFLWGLGMNDINTVNIGPNPFCFFPVFSKKNDMQNKTNWYIVVAFFCPTFSYFLNF